MHRHFNHQNIERHIVLVEPEVHWNTGNIGRTCLGADASLHLIKPLGFSLDSKQVKRAGLDYWEKVRFFLWYNFDHFLTKMSPRENEIAVFSKNGKYPFWHMASPEKLFLIFGSETKGLPDTILLTYRESSYYIPINQNIRCLNLSTSVGIALYESLRTSHFDIK